MFTLEDWEYHDTLSGVPQGGVVSPVLSNIYLERYSKPHVIEKKKRPRAASNASS